MNEGIYLMKKELPCSPKDIRLLKYALPSTLGNAEAEEVAARILMFSRERGQWVGVSYNKLIQVMEDDLEKERLAQEKWAQEVMEYNRTRQKHILTLGLSKKPKLPVKKEMPFSLISVTGLWPLKKGLAQLIENEWVNVYESVLYPSESLIRRIMEVQHIK